jgi:exodeoxyribonuclease-3
MRIISYNVNGLRAAVRKGLVDWLRANPADLYAFQEIKCNAEQAFEALSGLDGYHLTVYAAQKAGYSGLMVLSREPFAVFEGSGLETFDAEARVQRVDVGAFTLVNSYVPSGSSSPERQAAKDLFMPHLLEWQEALRRERPNVVIVGDFNVCHQDIDIHNPKGLSKYSGFLPHERAWMGQMLSAGLTDTFRHLNPDTRAYTWWSQRGAARAKNLGWRLDYQLTSANLLPRLRSHRLHPELTFSDHIPTDLTLEWKLGS